MSESILVVVALILAIYLGEKFKLNSGIISMAFAYLIGTFILGMTTAEYFATFPVKLFLVIFGISFFFNYAVVNSTLDKLANKLLFRFSNATRWLPIIIYLIAALISGMGAGYWSTVAIMGVIGLAICEATGLNRITMSIAISLGASGGANFMPSVQGALFNSLLLQTDVANLAALITRDIFLATIIYPFFGVLFLIFLDRKRPINKKFKVEDTAPFTGKQKLNIILILLLMAIVLLVPILAEFIPDLRGIQFVNDRLDISLLAIVFAVLAHLLDLAEGENDKVTERIPWNTIWLVTGVSMLIDVAVEAGALELLTASITKIPSPIMPVAITLIAGTMSIFSSTLGVVAPVMFPMIGNIALASGWSPSILGAAIIVGSTSTSVAPFSSGGSMLLASSNLDFEEQTDYFRELMYKATPLNLAIALVAALMMSFMPYFQ